MIAITFITSYAAVANNNVNENQTASSTTTIPKSYYVAGNANVIVTGYALAAVVSLDTNSPSVIAQVGNTMSKLESNGSINNYIANSKSFNVFLGTMNAYSLQQLLYNTTGNSIVTINATTYVSFPSQINLYYGSQSTPVYVPGSNYSVTIMPLLPLKTSVPVSIHALVTSNGTVYDNQIIIKPV